MDGVTCSIDLSKVFTLLAQITELTIPRTSSRAYARQLVAVITIAKVFSCSVLAAASEFCGAGARRRSHIHIRVVDVARTRTRDTAGRDRG
jgi:hypothetical protein